MSGKKKVVGLFVVLLSLSLLAFGGQDSWYQVYNFLIGQTTAVSVSPDTTVMTLSNSTDSNFVDSTNYNMYVSPVFFGKNVYWNGEIMPYVYVSDTMYLDVWAFPCVMSSSRNDHSVTLAKALMKSESGTADSILIFSDSLKAINTWTQLSWSRASGDLNWGPCAGFNVVVKRSIIPTNLDNASAVFTASFQFLGARQ